MTPPSENAAVTASYVLAWEEFLELYEESLPGPSVASLVATIFIAVAVGMFGGLLTYFVDSQDKIVASVFCWMSLALFVLAFWDFKIRTRQRRRKSLAALRSVYDRYYLVERTFEFNRDKWIASIGSTRQETSWSDVISATVRKNVLYIATQAQAATLPQRVFTVDQWAALEALSLGNDEAMSEFRVSFLDYFLTQSAALWRGSPFLMAVAHIAGLGFFWMIASLMYHSTGPGVVWGWLIAGVFLFLTISTQFWYLLTKFYNSSKRLRLPWQARFGDAGLRTKGEDLQTFSAWKSLPRFRETTGCFLVYYKPNAYYIYPKRCLRAEQRVALRELLNTKLPSA